MTRTPMAQVLGPSTWFPAISGCLDPLLQLPQSSRPSTPWAALPAEAPVLAERSTALGGALERSP